jgi:hypothetical protein
VIRIIRGQICHRRCSIRVVFPEQPKAYIKGLEVSALGLVVTSRQNAMVPR